MLPHLRRRPLHFFILPGYVLMSFVMAIVKICALCTIRTQRWLTRPVEVSGDGSVVRTKEVATDAHGASVVPQAIESGVAR